MNANPINEEWVPLSVASFKLKTEGLDISVSKLSRLAKAGEIRSESDPIDSRVKLVELNELRERFSKSKRFRA